jgi:hypothetical protein
VNTLAALCQTLRLGRIVAVFAAGLILLLNVACSSENNVGARPNNPPVQMGGQNNPHKAGGDGYNDYQMSTDPTVSKRDRASISGSSQLVAAADQKIERAFSGRDNQSMGETSRKARNAMKELQQAPEEPQAVFDRSDPDAKLLEKVGNTFKEASKHLTGSTEKSIEQSGLAKPE